MREFWITFGVTIYSCKIIHFICWLMYLWVDEWLKVVISKSKFVNENKEEGWICQGTVDSLLKAKSRKCCSVSLLALSFNDKVIIQRLLMLFFTQKLPLKACKKWPHYIKEEVVTSQVICYHIIIYRENHLSSSPAF